MPTYEYACDKCGRFEVVQKITEEPLAECPTCGGHVQRLISKNVGIIFKGSGFYITDTRAAGNSAETSSDEKAS
ncbi:MAG: FmdB family transcriptional regulator [Firmicutes bacterium]|nr:FmdB family transcriptional regulator [Bacillota bacterium]